MDVISLLTGFLVGTFTGAAGNYLADKFTDTRRDRRLIKQEKELQMEIERRFPLIIAEIRGDLSANRHVRAFFVKSSRTTLAGSEELYFEYHTDKHSDIQPALLMLQEYGFITDITPGNCPKYRIQEKLADWLIDPKILP